MKPPPPRRPRTLVRHTSVARSRSCARVVINCAAYTATSSRAGAWLPVAPPVAAIGRWGGGEMGDPAVQVGAGAAPFHPTPRRQFVVLQPPDDAPPSSSSNSSPRSSPRGIIWQTLYGNVVVGPTAEPSVAQTPRRR